MEIKGLIDLHTHSEFSPDGCMPPVEMAGRAVSKGYLAMAITDHANSTNLEAVLGRLLQYCRHYESSFLIRVIPGIELTYVIPSEIAVTAQRARSLGAKLVVVHGETIVEPVFPGTNLAALQAKGLVDILAHPGILSDEEASLAAKHEIYLELSGRRGNCFGNGRTACLALKHGAKLLVNSDLHSPDDYLSVNLAANLALAAGLNETQAKEVVMDNPRLVLKRVNLRV